MSTRPLRIPEDRSGERGPSFFEAYPSRERLSYGSVSLSEAPARRAPAALRFVAGFSVDLEGYFQAEALRGFCPPVRWDTFEDRTERNADGVLELLERSGTKATFFVFGWTAERHPILVRRIASAGHEIASRGFAHDPVCRQGPPAFGRTSAARVPCFKT